MTLDHTTLAAMRRVHAGWRLLRSDHAPLVAAFLERVFVTPNVRGLSRSDLTEALEDELFALRNQLGEEAYPRSAQEYLDDWAGDEKGWLRKYYRQDSDEPYYDLTPPAEKAILWLSGLMERSFVGTESRLKTLFSLLRQMKEGSETDPDERIAELQRRREAIDAEMERVRAGEMATLDDTALKDRYQQFVQLARELLSDFREVEQNFRKLDRSVRERIALWEGGKGTLLEEIMGERDAIVDSDQGKSFRAFWDFLMSPARQEELGGLLDRVLALPPVEEMDPGERLSRVHYDWLEASEHTQRTVARLSRELRRFIDDQAWLENRRIMDILHGIESSALELRGNPPRGEVTSIADTAADVELPMERPLFTPPAKPVIPREVLEYGDQELDAAALFSLVVVDKTELQRHIDEMLQWQRRVTLAEIVRAYPLRRGLSELVAYLQLAGEAANSLVDEESTETVTWEGEAGVSRRARLPEVSFVRD